MLIERHQVTHVRRRADPVLGPARESRTSRSTTRLADVRRRWRRAGAADAGGARRAHLHAGPSQPRLRHDRDQRLRTGELRRRLRQPIPTSTGRTPTIVMDVEIRDRREPRRRGESGEIWISRPTLIRGYWRQARATADARHGWLRTGDLGSDRRGGLPLHRGPGQGHDPARRARTCTRAEVESAIYEHPAVFEAAVFGLPDERLGESVAAVMVVRGTATSPKTTCALLSSRPGRLQDPDARCLHHETAARERGGQVLQARDARALLLASAPRIASRAYSAR